MSESGSKLITFYSLLLMSTVLYFPWAVSRCLVIVSTHAVLKALTDDTDSYDDEIGQQIVDNYCNLS